MNSFVNLYDWSFRDLRLFSEGESSIGPEKEMRKAAKKLVNERIVSCPIVYVVNLLNETKSHPQVVGVFTRENWGKLLEHTKDFILEKEISTEREFKWVTPHMMMPDQVLGYNPRNYHHIEPSTGSKIIFWRGDWRVTVHEVRHGIVNLEEMNDR